MTLNLVVVSLVDLAVGAVGFVGGGRGRQFVKIAFETIRFAVWKFVGSVFERAGCFEVRIRTFMSIESGGRRSNDGVWEDSGNNFIPEDSVPCDFAFEEGDSEDISDDILSDGTSFKNEDSGDTASDTASIAIVSANIDSSCIT